MDLLPPEQAERRAELQRTIDTRIDDLIAAADRYRLLRKVATSYRGDVRDFMLFFCTVLFTGVWGASITTRAVGYPCSSC